MLTLSLVLLLLLLLLLAVMPSACVLQHAD
jgi:hypothetical protein